MRFKKITGFIHLWLGLISGLVVLFLGLTGCILAFEKEISSLTNGYQYAKVENREPMLPSELQPIAEKALPGKHPHSVLYEKGKSVQAIFYGEGYYDIVYLNPYNGAVLKVKDMTRDFFRIILNGHYNLWLPIPIGQPIVASATLIFLFMMISGLILWWPRNKAATKQRFRIKWNVRWRRKNYDLHNVLGFYMTWVAIFLAITGLVMGFQWFAKGFYFVTSGGSKMTEYYEPVSVKKPLDSTVPAVDAVYAKMNILYPAAETMEIHFPESDSATIAGAANPIAGTYWKVSYRYFDQYSLQEIPVKHAFGNYENTDVAQKISRLNYDVHVGSIGGLPTKFLAFFASLIAASLPVTGFMIWWGRKKRPTKTTVAKSVKAVGVVS